MGANLRKGQMFLSNINGSKRVRFSMSQMMTMLITSSISLWIHSTRPNSLPSLLCL